MQTSFGWKIGLEPTTFGTTIRRSNRLSYIHHVDNFGAKIVFYLKMLQPYLQVPG
jgi:hypothetical protein